MRAVLLAVFTFVTGLAEAAPVPEEYAKLVTHLDHLRATYNIPAYAINIVSTEKELLLHATGVSDRKSNKPATVDTVFRIGSITKSFTALAMLQLQSKGIIDLSTPVLAYTPDAPLRNEWQDQSPVTVAQLLEHTAGFQDLNKTEFDHSDPSPLTLRQGLFFSRPRKLQWRPGQFFSYSNVGAGYAAYVLEKRTATSFEKYIQQCLFDPLEMRHASLLLTDATKDKLATGYDTDGISVIPYWHMIMRPFAGINATPREMGHFVKMLLNYGQYKNQRILDKPAILRMEVPQTSLAARHGLQFGYGLGNYQYVSHGHLFHGHGGDGDGYLAHYAYNRDLDRGYFIVINAFQYDALAKMKLAIEEVLIQDAKTESPPRMRVSQTQLQTLTGEFEQLTERFQWSANPDSGSQRRLIVREGDKLFVQYQNGQREELIPVTERLFRMAAEPVATMAFVEEKGTLYFISEKGNFQRMAASIAQE